MASHCVIYVLLKFTQIDRLRRDSAIAGRFVPRCDKIPRISTSFDDDENLVHILNSTTVVPQSPMRTAGIRKPVSLDG
jgi:hypothetical protein